MRQAQADGLPVVQIWDFDARAGGFVQIGFNHTRVGELMARHLLSCGHDDLVYVDNSVPHDLRAHERGKAFARVARKARARVRVLNMPRLEPMAAGRAVLQQLRAEAAMPRAMAFASDFPAAGAWLAAQDAGIAVPAQLAMLGFGDYPIASQLGAGLSTVSVDRRSATPAPPAWGSAWTASRWARSAPSRCWRWCIRSRRRPWRRSSVRSGPGSWPAGVRERLPGCAGFARCVVRRDRHGSRRANARSARSRPRSISSSARQNSKKPQALRGISIVTSGE